MFLIILSCKKEEESCGENMTLNAPISVYEGETINLKPVNAPVGTNTYYNWELVDMSKYPTGFTPSEPGPTAIINASIFDEGEYIFLANPNADGCSNVAKASKYVKVLALPSPCYDNVATNVLEITESNSTSGSIYIHAF